MELSIADVQRIDIKAGEVLLVTWETQGEKLTHDLMRNLRTTREGIAAALPEGVKVIMVPDKLSFSIISGEDAVIERLKGNTF